MVIIMAMLINTAMIARDFTVVNAAPKRRI